MIGTDLNHCQIVSESLAGSRAVDEQALAALAVAPNTPAPDEAVAFERISFAFSSRIELDSQGRLLLNERLRKRAGLKDHITLIGVRDHIELWNDEDWEQYVSNHMTQYQRQMSQARRYVLQKQNEES